MAKYLHYGETTLSMCRTTKRPSIMTMDRELVTCGICIDHLERGFDLYRAKMNHLTHGRPPSVADNSANPTVPDYGPPTVLQTSQITVYTDGAAEPNPGRGGYGAVLYGLPDRNKPLEVAQGFRLTTNNRMEIMAVIAALESTPAMSSIVVWSDSRYVVDAFNKNWVKNWKANNWMRAKGQPLLNPDLWERLSGLVDARVVTFSWVKGHSGNPGNELADDLAVRASKTENLPRDTGYDGDNTNTHPAHTVPTQPAESPWKTTSKGGHWREYCQHRLNLNQFRKSRDWHGAIFFKDEQRLRWVNLGADLDEAKKALEYRAELLPPDTSQR